MTVESRIGATLAELRAQARLSPLELARLAGTPVSTVTGIERGIVEPPVSLVVRLTAAIASRLREERG